MNSPFPGMDPYLEQHWRSVHHRLITYAGDRLQAVLPPRFRVEVEERVFVLGDSDEWQSVAPEFSVVQRPHPERPPARPAGEAAVAQPVVIELLDEPITETYLEIIDTVSGNKVVTAIEFISPTNKTTGDGNDLYVRKQREYRAGGVSQVEIDLTRTGDRGLVFPLMHIPHHYRTLYLASVRRAWQPGAIEVYPLPLHQPLPTLGLPLGAAEQDMPLDLQGLVDECYRNGRYGDTDYRKDPLPPLPPDEAAWAEELLRQKGLR